MTITKTTSMSSRLEGIAADFPILSRQVHGHRLVYLDSAATSQKPVQVLSAMQDYYRSSNANVHRGVYLLAEEATELYEAARETVARFIRAPSSEDVIFTRNATEAINLVAYSWALANVREGDVIAVSALEHHSNFVPWQAVAERKGAELEVLNLLPDGHLDLDDLSRVLATGTVKLVAIAAVSNVLGVINPINTVVDHAHACGALVLVDAAQMAPHMRLDVEAMDADFVAFTGHKMLGPMGIGVLWARHDILSTMDPFLYGGEMIRRVSEQGTSWNDLPWKFEAGTPNVEGAVGLAAAIRYLGTIGMDTIREHERSLTEYALDALQATGASVLGPLNASERGGVIAFNVRDIHPHDLASILDSQRGVAIRAGHHCAQPLHDRLGLAATARASFYIYNQPADVDALCEGIEIARGILG
jgi:cysteine desulfurase/selenocysteine lyase